MILGAAGALVAGAWLGPALAMLVGLGLLGLAGAEEGFLLLLTLVGLSLLLGAPAAVLAALRGVVAAPIGLAAGATLLLGFLLFHLEEVLPVRQALPAAAAAAALAMLWGGLGVAAGLGLSPLPGIGAGLLLAGGMAFGLGGVAGALWGLAAGAALAGFLAAVPAAAARIRPKALAGPAACGLALALAVVAAPLVALLSGGPVMALTLPLLVALPGLVLVALARSLPPFGLASGLLVVQALAVALGLLLGGAPAGAGIVMPESLALYQMALIGAGFLPAFAALQAVLLGRPGPGPAILSALLLAALSAGLGPLLALAAPGLAAHAALVAPLLATGFAFWLVLRDPEDAGEQTHPEDAGEEPA
jgi:hypothetical protein